MSKESKHLKAGCPLPISMIAKKRRQFTLEARKLWVRWYSAPEIRRIVTERTILYMEEFRNQTTLPEYPEYFRINLTVSD